MMGSGKTTVGRLLAAKTGWPRYDNDELLVALYGQTSKQLVETSGEDAMRTAEDAALARGLAQTGPCIIEAAGGTILSASSREGLVDAIVVWLRASPETLYQRAIGAAHRPWLDGGEEWVRVADAERRPLYASVADVVIDTDGRAPGEVAQDAFRRINELCREPSAPAP
jgi:shikimate kinase